MSAWSQKFSIKPNGTYYMCHGDSVKLTAINGFTNYHWSTNQKGQSITVKYAGRYIGYGYSGRTKFADTVEVKLYPKKTLTLTANPKTKEICKGDSVVIEASSGFKSYEWTDKKRGQRVVYKPSSSISIVCEAVDSNGCVYKEDIRITVKNCSGCPKVLSGPAHLCVHGDSVVLEAKSGYKDYAWVNGPKGRLYTVKKTGWYYIEFTNGTQKCKDSIYVGSGKLKFGIETKPHPPVICKGDSIKLIAPYKGFKTFWWSTGHRYNDFWFKPTKSQKVVVEATDENGCHYRDTVEITVKDTCNKDSCDVIGAWPRTVICGDHDSVSLEAKYGYKKYTWWDNHSGRIRHVKKAGWYWVEVISQAGDTCRDSIYIHKATAKKLKLGSAPSPAVICPGEKVVIEATGGFKSYWWNTGHKNTNRVVLTNIQRTMGVVVEAVDSHGCPARAVIYITVKDTCRDSCDVLGAWPKKVLCGDKDSVLLEAKYGFSKYTWNDGKGGRLRTVKKEGWYWIEVISTKGDTCRDSIFIHKVKPKELKLFTNPDPPKVCKGKKLVIEASSGFLGYWWSTRDTGDRIVLYPTTSGKVVVEAIDSHGCVVRKELAYKVDTCHGSIGEIKADLFSIYPNPASHSFVIEQKTGSLGVATISDQTGRIVASYELKSRKTTIPVTELPSGVYIVTVSNGAYKSSQLLQIE